MSEADPKVSGMQKAAESPAAPPTTDTTVVVVKRRSPLRWWRSGEYRTSM